MTRIGYAIASGILLFLVYYLTLADDPDAVIRVFPEPLGAEFELRTPGWHQIIDGESLLVNDVARPLVASKAKNLGKYLKKVSARAQHVIEDVEAQVLPDYGLDGSRELRYADQRYRWAQVDGQGYIWHEQQQCIYNVNKNYVEQLDSYAKRMDNNQLISIAGKIVRMEIDDLLLERVTRYGGWLSSTQPHRPAFNSRGAEFLDILKGLTLKSVRGLELAADAQPIWEYKAELEDGQLFVLQVFEEGEAYKVKAGDQPVQPLSKAEWQMFEDLREAFKEDYLVDFSMGMEGVPFDRIIIKSGGIEKYRIQRHGTEDSSYQVPGYSYWELIWPGGRESASPQVAMQFFYGLNSIAVRDVDLQPVNAPLLPSDDSLSVYCMNGEEDQKCVVHWFANGTARSQFHAGTIKETEGVEPLLNFEKLKDPSNFLNPFLLPADVRRIEKMQRLYYEDAFRGELLKRQSLASWQVAYYSSPGHQDRYEAADLTASSRVALALVHLQAQEIRFADPTLIEKFSKPQRAIDVRLGAWEINNGEDEQFLEETLARDWGMSLTQIDQQWWALNRDETLAYQLQDDDVEQLFTSVAPGYIFAGVPGQIEKMRMVYQEKSYLLQRSGEHWNTRLNGAWRALDNLQVRQFMRHLVRCRAERIDTTKQSIPSAAVIAELHVFVPGLEERQEQITISVAAQENGLYPVTVFASTGTQALNGVAYCTPALVEPLLREQRWFLKVEDQVSTDQDHDEH